MSDMNIINNEPVPIKKGDIVKSASGGYGPVLEINLDYGRPLYWIDFKYGYTRSRKCPNHKMWADDVTLYVPGEISVTSHKKRAIAENVTVCAPGEISVTRVCLNCGVDMSQFARQAKTCSAKCRKSLSRKSVNKGS